MSDLNKVKQLINKWRETKKRKNDPFPETLLKKIAELTQHYSQRKICLELKFSRYSWSSNKFQKLLKKYSLEKKKDETTEIRLIEVASPCQSFVTSQTKIHLQRANGSTMSMEVNSLEVKAIISLFLEGPLCSN